MSGRIYAMENQTGLLDEYYRENARKLHEKVDKILSGFGGITEKDYDDFYSIANEVFTDVLKKYDASQNFDSFLFSCLSNKIKTEVTKRNRIKRLSERNTISLDMPVGETETALGELLVSDFDIEKELRLEENPFMEERILAYFEGLSDLQRRILELKMDNIPKKQIVQILKITEKIYDINFKQLRSYEKTSILKFGQLLNSKQLLKRSNEKEIEEEKQMVIQTSEISKNTSYSIAAYIKRLHKYSIRGDHPLQRNSNQWSNIQKYNLITTVLNRYPIPEIILAEQVKADRTENWLIDGKQRLTNLSDFEEDVFKIGKNAERPIIQYQVILKDENGIVLLDEEGSPQYENREFDVRGKYYSDLPEELKERFNDYTIPAVQYLSCSDDDIEYHIRRYNASKPMTAAQKGMTHLGEQYAKVVKKVAQHPFFKNKADFRISEFVNGTVDRVVTESIMVINFLYDWKKKQEDICAYLKENVKVSQFDSFEKMLDRLSEAISDDVSDMFNSKDAFLWFGLFHKFSKLGIDDECFIDFMREFQKSLHAKKLGKLSYDILCMKGTKDKASVTDKLILMEALMNEFLHIDSGTPEKKLIVENNTLKKYIVAFSNSEIVRSINIMPKNSMAKTAILTLMAVCGQEKISDSSIRKFIQDKKDRREEIEDTLLYLDCLNEWTLDVNSNCAIFQKENLPVLTKMLQYVYKNEMEEDTAMKWFAGFVDNFEINGGFPEKDEEKYKTLINSLHQYFKYMQSRESREKIN